MLVAGFKKVFQFSFAVSNKTNIVYFQKNIHTLLTEDKGNSEGRGEGDLKGGNFQRGGEWLYEVVFRGLRVCLAGY